LAIKDYNSDDENNPKRREILAFFVFSLMLFFLISFVSYDPYDLGFYTTQPNTPRMNYGGIIGAYYIFSLVFLYGFSVVLFPIYLLSLSIRLFQGLGFWNFMKWFFYFQFYHVSISIILGISNIKPLSGYTSQFQITSAGGIIGTILGQEIVFVYLGKLGGIVLFLFLSLISLQGIISFSYMLLVKRIYNVILFCIVLIKVLSQKICHFAQILYKKYFKEEKENDFEKYYEKLEDKTVQSDTEQFEDSEPTDIEEKEEKRIIPVVKNTPEKDFPKKDIIRKKTEKWEFPSLDVLKDPLTSSLDLEENVQANAGKLVQTLKEFDIESSVVGIETGPVITRYEIQIASGIKVQKVTVLDNDIGMAMRAKSVRIIAPIPGKSAIGVEIPNQIRKMVFFKELLVSNEFRKSNAVIPLVLGKDISGRSVIADLTKMPHLLIAGSTGAGKSVCINTIIISILYTLSPSEIKIMLVDPKKVELAIYKNLPHLFVPLITQANKVALGLKCLIDEMERRYQLLKEVGVRNIDSYNKKDKKPYRDSLPKDDESIDLMEIVPDKMPYILVIIDELADLMMVAKSEIETSIVRLAQLSRAVGIHLILATQRPSVDVVTGLIKANVSARIAFRVSSRIDSRTVLDTGGADKLLGQGDMLFLNPGDTDLKRVQGAYLEDEEIHGVVEHWTKQAEPVFDDRAMNVIHAPEVEGEAEDPLFNEAVEAIQTSKQASTSFLQKKFRIGYNRASRLIDELEARGVIGPATQGGKTREIYLDKEEHI